MMLFNSIDFLLFFPIVVAIYFVIPKKLRYIWLLMASYYFYMSWNPRYAILMLLSTIITYVSSIGIEKSNAILWKMVWVAGSLISNLSILCIFKYANFILVNIERVLITIGIEITECRLDLLLPVGISFYTFQALSYTIDVYRGKIKAERNILKYSLFVSFFPQLVAGPIERSKNLLYQIQNCEEIKLWNFERVRDGFLLMMWGLFQKLVIADRISLLVDTVINNYEKYGFVEISVAMILFAFQIYCDFGGYTNIARGTARIMGFELMKNFQQPYLATSIKEFWRRWHISLTSWFTDYVYIPLGGNRKGSIKKYVNILIVFGISGFWHGASWNFIVWGLLNCFVILVSQEFEPLYRRFRNKFSKLVSSYPYHCFEATRTFLLMGLIRSLDCYRNVGVTFWKWGTMFTRFNWDEVFGGGLTSLGLKAVDYVIIAVAIVIIFVVSKLGQKRDLRQALVGKTILSWSLAGVLLICILLFGAYGMGYDASQFIYNQF